MVTVVMSCVKYLLFVFNLIFAVSGIAIVVIGSLLQVVYHHYSKFVYENFSFLPILIIVIGAIIFIIAFFGCCGTIKENHCMISTFASLLLIIFVLEVVAAVGAFLFRNELRGIITERMNSSLQHYESDKEVANSWDILQTDLQCCGVNGTSDWKSKIPLSCCPDDFETCTQENAYKKGCVDALYTFTEQDAFIPIVIATVVAFIQLIGVAFACSLAHSIRKGYETV